VANRVEGNKDDIVWSANTLTGVMVPRIGLAAAERARNRWERNFAKWIVTHDQTWFGPGCVGWAWKEVPWGDDPWVQDAHRSFVRDALQHAASDEIGRRMPWRPAPGERQSDELLELAAQIGRFDPRSSEPVCAREWSWPLQPSDERCALHGVYLHREGCLLCRDGWR
jgi:hypothetical protein